MQDEEQRQAALVARIMELYNAGKRNELHYLMMVPFFNESVMFNTAIPTANGAYQEGISYGYGNMFSYSETQFMPFYQMFPTAADRNDFISGYGMG